MDKEYARILARIRMERTVELLSEAQNLLAKESYKSANNRAFYSLEKSIKALLAIVGKEVQRWDFFSRRLSTYSKSGEDS